MPINGKSNISRWFSPNYSFELKSEIADFFIKRGLENDSFENKVLAKAKDNGAQIFNNSYPLKFKWDEQNYVNNVIAKSNSKKIEIKPEFIIGADGVNSEVLKITGLSKTEKKYGMFYAYGAIGKSFDIPNEITHVFFDRNIAPGGYIYALKNNNNKCVLGLGLDSWLTEKKIEQHYQMLLGHNKISKIIKKAKIKEYFGGIGKFGYLKNHSIGNIMLVGDAGRFVDPFLGFGLKQAIITGYISARVCKNVKDGITKNSIYLEYESAISNLKKQIKLGILFRKIYRKINNQDIDIIIKILKNLNNEGLTLDYLFQKNNRLLFKHILKNGKTSSRIIYKSLPNIIEYLLKTHHM